MIDPSKATKGRRMSKKTRKKSPKTSAAKVTAKATRARSVSAAKKPAAKSRRAAPAKSAPKKAGKRLADATPKASHRAPSKPLRLPEPKSPAVKNKPAKSEAVKSAPVISEPATLAEGSKAPAFRLPRDGGATVSLADFAGQKLVLFFYPRADTPGCTKEAIDFTRLAGAFAESKTAVLGVSADPLKAQEAFRNKHQLSVPLISDEQHEMLEAYGAWGEKSMYRKTFLGIIRTTVLIGPDARIMRIWRHVKVDGHADTVLAAAREA
jgi:thioredoxin-dependent peroxiredoxin